MDRGSEDFAAFYERRRDACFRAVLATWFGLKTGRQTTCVPQYAVAADPR